MTTNLVDFAFSLYALPLTYILPLFRSSAHVVRYSRNKGRELQKYVSATSQIY